MYLKLSLYVKSEDENRTITQCKDYVNFGKADGEQKKYEHCTKIIKKSLAN